jgi:hypothetical protein
LPVYFYLLFLSIKVPLAVSGTFLVGLFVSVRRWRTPGHTFVLFMLLFWVVPYSLAGAKWLRYTLSLMPFVYMSAAIGAMALIRWSGGLLEKLRAGPAPLRAATAILVLVLVGWPAWSAYASAPHYAMYTNVLGSSYTAYFFPHDEFYDDGINDAIRFVCEHAPRDATIVTETPASLDTTLRSSAALICSRACFRIQSSRCPKQLPPTSFCKEGAHILKTRTR